MQRDETLRQRFAIFGGELVQAVDQVLQGIGGEEVTAALGKIELYDPAVFCPVSSNKQVLLDQGGHRLGCRPLGCATRFRECADSAGAVVCPSKIAKCFPLGCVQPFGETAAVTAPRNTGEEFCDGACSHGDPLVASAYDGGGIPVNAS